jgi:uncharacterized membrane protein
LFLYRVCNKSSYDAWMALSTRAQPGGNVWRNHGWYGVQRGQCVDLGSYPKQVFYWFGRDAQGGTWGNGTTPDELTCVNLSGTFDYTYSDAAGSCPAGTTQVKAKRVDNVTMPLFTTTLND